MKSMIYLWSGRAFDSDFCAFFFLAVPPKQPVFSPGKFTKEFNLQIYSNIFTNKQTN